MKRISLVPQGLRNIASILAELNAAGGQGWKAWLSEATGFLLSFLLGAGPALLFVDRFDQQGKADSASGIAGGLIALGGILAGFVVTLMLFTGRLEVQGLTLEQVSGYSQRVKALLSSQFTTLCASMFLTVFACAWLVLYHIEAEKYQILPIAIALFGYLSVCILRAITLPLHIYELHQAWLDDVLTKKISEDREKYRKRAHSAAA